MPIVVDGMQFDSFFSYVQRETGISKLSNISAHITSTSDIFHKSKPVSREWNTENCALSYINALIEKEKKQENPSLESNIYRLDNLYQLREIYNLVNNLQNLKWFRANNRFTLDDLNIKYAFQFWKSQVLFAIAEEGMDKLIQDTFKKNIQELLKKRPPIFTPHDDKAFFIEVVAVAQDAVIMAKKELEVNFTKIDLEMAIRNSVSFFNEHLANYCTKDNIFPTATTFFEERYKNMPPSNYLNKDTQILLSRWFEDTLRKTIASTDGKRMYVEFLDLRQRVIGCTLVRGLDNQNKTVIFYKCHTLKTLFEEFTELDVKAQQKQKDLQIKQQQKQKDLQIKYQQNIAKFIDSIKTQDHELKKILDESNRDLNKILNDFRNELNHIKKNK